MSMDILRERLIAAKLADSLSLGHNTAAADVAVNQVRAWLTSDATVERVARALADAMWARRGHLSLNQATEMARAALDAALATAGEAS